MKTFFEKIPLNTGVTIFVNYLSAVVDASLERKWAFTARQMDAEDEIIAAQEDFLSLADARHSAWSLFGDLVAPAFPDPKPQKAERPIPERGDKPLQ